MSSRPFMASRMAAPAASDLGRCLRLCQSIHLVATTDDLWRPRRPPRMIKFWAPQRPRCNYTNCMFSLPDHESQNNKLIAVTTFQICFIILGLRNLYNTPYTHRSQLSTELLLSERSCAPESTVGPFTRVTEVPKSAIFRCHFCIWAVFFGTKVALLPFLLLCLFCVETNAENILLVVIIHVFFRSNLTPENSAATIFLVSQLFQRIIPQLTVVDLNCSEKPKKPPFTTLIKRMPPSGMGGEARRATNCHIS